MTHTVHPLKNASQWSNPDKYYMETLSASLDLCDRTQRAQMIPITTYKGPVMWSFDAFFVVSWTNWGRNNGVAGDLRRPVISPVSKSHRQLLPTNPITSLGSETARRMNSFREQSILLMCTDKKKHKLTVFVDRFEPTTDLIAVWSRWPSHTDHNSSVSCLEKHGSFNMRGSN